MSTIEQLPELLTTAHCCNLLGITRKTLAKWWQETGDFIPPDLCPEPGSKGPYYWKKPRVVAWLNGRRV